MAFTQYIKSSVDPTDLTLPIFNPNDSWLTPDTLMLYDFRRTKCYPSQLAAPANGAQIVNLQTESINGVLGVSTSGLTFSPGKLTFTGVANNYINFGASSYDLPAQGSPDFLIIAWIRVHADKSTANVQSIMHKGATAASPSGYTFSALYNGGLNNVRMSVSNGVATLTPVDVPFTENDTWVQFGFAFEGGKVKIYKNGALASESATTLAKPLATHANPVKSGSGDAWNQYKGDLARIGLTKLTVSSTALARVQADYDANHSAIALVV